MSPIALESIDLAARLAAIVASASAKEDHRKDLVEQLLAAELALSYQTDKFDEPRKAFFNSADCLLMLSREEALPLAEYFKIDLAYLETEAAIRPIQTKDGNSWYNTHAFVSYVMEKLQR